MSTAEYLSLKWGTLKGWNVGENEAAFSAIEKYHQEPTCFGAMQQRDTPSQKQAICELIDAIRGPITNDWTGEEMSKDEAKKYVLEYDMDAAA
jgi:hypothetical protein